MNDKYSHPVIVSKINCEKTRGGGERSFPKYFVGANGPTLETRALLQSKICGFPHPVSDMSVKPFQTSKISIRFSLLCDLS